MQWQNISQLLSPQLNPDDHRRWVQYALLMRMDKPIGTLLLLWPTLWALWIAAEGTPPLNILIIFCLGVFLMRSAGCVINDYADRNIDGKVSRTSKRPLATGKVEEKEALFLFAALAMFAFLLVLLLNLTTILMSFVALFLAATYPFMKRYTYLPQVYLGAAFGWSIPMAFTAINETVPPEGWVLYIANILWTTAYDTMYAMVDRPDDLKIGVKSTAILFGDADRMIIGVLQAFMLACFLIIGNQLNMGSWFYLGVITATMIGLYHQKLIHHRKRPDCFKAFLHNNYLGMALFVGIFLDYLLG